ncbi:hypothetical protein BDV09DRAFT_13109 [Aspergillus tetrazonus]
MICASSTACSLFPCGRVGGGPFGDASITVSLIGISSGNKIETQSRSENVSCEPGSILVHEALIEWSPEDLGGFRASGLQDVVEQVCCGWSGFGSFITPLFRF